MFNIAHRGSSGTHPENTLASFLAAVEDGADMCELDVQSTRDGAVVVMHDDRVDRTTDGVGAIATLSLEEIRRLDAGAKFNPKFRGERVPTLDEVFRATSGKVGLNIEMKEGAAAERKVCELIRAHDALSTSIVSSFELRALEELRAIDPEVRLGVLGEENPAAMLDAASRLGAWSINPRFDLAQPAFCIEAHKRGLKVLVWTVDAPEAMRLLIEWGVDGIITNHPARLRDVLAGR